jgi:hypothetical protein
MFPVSVLPLRDATFLTLFFAPIVIFALVTPVLQQILVLRTQMGRCVGRTAFLGQAAFHMIFSTFLLETPNPVVKRDQII